MEYQRQSQAWLKHKQLMPRYRLTEEWVQRHRAQGLAGLHKNELHAYMELVFRPSVSAKPPSVRSFLTTAKDAMIHTFGWPIGVLLDNRPDMKPKPTAAGIFAEVVSSVSGYDYRAMKLNGSFYLLRSLFEGQREGTQSIFFDTRIVHINAISNETPKC